MLLHRPKPPGLDPLGQHRVVPRVRQHDLRSSLRRQRDPLEEHSLVALQRQARQVGCGGRVDPRDDLGDVSVDVGSSECRRRPTRGGGRRARSTARRRAADRRAAARRPGASPPRCSPSASAPRPEVGRKRRSKSRARSTVPTIDSSGTTCSADRALADESERLDHLLVGEDHADVVGLPPQPRNQLRGAGTATRAQEIVLRVDAGHPGGAGHRHVIEVSCWPVRVLEDRRRSATRATRNRSRADHSRVEPLAEVEPLAKSEPLAAVGTEPRSSGSRTK